MTEAGLLIGTALFIALTHTLIGVDHYVPFIALSKSNNWALKKTIFIVILCGIGHVLGSVILGIVGIAISANITSLINVEDLRGTFAAYVLVAFGLVYTIYGIRAAIKNTTHSHIGLDGKPFTHTHNFNTTEHQHKKNNALWGLFIFFVLGPCEPLIPILMYPAATMNIFILVMVTVSFAVVTISVMLAMTLLGLKGLQLIKPGKLTRYAHAIAGSVILLCGVALLTLPV